ncbi:hypothetical protein WJR50_28850 [Catalinimonas sp. 4WD22]|uniref:hypothetical protein n=1 Tax=Catalinimonas locisalis TaxID=3133978 RepID=UPI003100D883
MTNITSPDAPLAVGNVLEEEFPPSPQDISTNTRHEKKRIDMYVGNFALFTITQF